MPNTHVVLAGSGRSHRAGAEILGRTDSNEWVEATLKLRRKAPLPEPVAGGAALTREQLEDTHGLVDGDIEKVTAAFRPYGLTVISSNRAARSVRLAGVASQMEAAFNLQLFRATHDSHNYRARNGMIHIPAELDGVVTGVFGLDTRRMVRRRGLAHVKKSGKALPPANARPWYLPQELAAAYNFPNNGGAGQTIGLLEFGGEILESDLKLFASLAKLPKVAAVEQVNVDPLSQQDSSDPDATGEVMLDVEVAAAICPDANVVGYFSTFTEQGWVDCLDAAIHDSQRNPTVLSVSWGLAEGQDIWTTSAMQHINDSMKAAATLGIPVCLASGDDGSQDQVEDGRAHIDFPASSPFVLCVGGTSLSKQTGLETVWKEGDGLRKDNGGAGGGGVSEVFPPPAWQQGINIASVNPGAGPGRICPDVSANAAGSTGYFTVSTGKAGVVGGTSAAAPLWASLIARINTARGRGVGYITPLFYQANPNTGGLPLGQAALRDVTQGDNISAAAGGYTAGPGFDAASGWGTPDGVKLQQMLP